MARTMLITERSARRDKRTTEEVEMSRCMCNFKFGRNKAQRDLARSEAFKPKLGKFKGTYISYAARNQKIECDCPALKVKADMRKKGICVP